MTILGVDASTLGQVVGLAVVEARIAKAERPSTARIDRPEPEGGLFAEATAK